jgi:predicted HTH transcriptional regulator
MLSPGYDKMRKLMRDAGLLPPLFESGYFFTATFRRPGNKKAVRKKPRIEGVNGGVNEGVNGGVNLLHAFICDHPGKRTSEISKKF